jgi:hypothetical protein
MTEVPSLPATDSVPRLGVEGWVSMTARSSWQTWWALPAALCLTLGAGLVGASTAGAVPPLDCSGNYGTPADPSGPSFSTSTSSSVSHSALVHVVGLAPPGTTFVLQGNGETLTFDATGALVQSALGPGSPHEYYSQTQDGGALGVTSQTTQVVTQSVTTSASTSTFQAGPPGGEITYTHCHQDTHTHTNTDWHTVVTNTFVVPVADAPTKVAGADASVTTPAAVAISAVPAVAG